MKKPHLCRSTAIKQLKTVITAAISKLESPEQAETLSADLYRAMLGGLISDAEYLNFRTQIQEKYLSNNWAMPIE